MANKGTVEDYFFVVAVIFVFSIAILIGNFLLTNFQQTFVALNQSTIANGIITQAVQQYNVFDGLFAFAFVGLSVGVILGSFMINSHPAFFIFSVIVLAIVGFLGLVFTEIYRNIANDPTITCGGTVGQCGNNFPIMTFIMSNLIFILIPLGFLTAIVLYSKTSASPQGGF